MREVNLARYVVKPFSIEDPLSIVERGMEGKKPAGLGSAGPEFFLTKEYPSSNRAFAYFAHGMVAVMIAAALVLISEQNYLVLHGIVEISDIAVSLAIFLLVWNTRRNITDSFLMLLGISFLFIGGIDLLHTLAYKGMGVFSGNSADLPTQLWLAARYFQGITFFAASLFIGRSLTKDRTWDLDVYGIGCTAFACVMFASIFCLAELSCGIYRRLGTYRIQNRQQVSHLWDSHRHACCAGPMGKIISTGPSGRTSSPPRFSCSQENSRLLPMSVSMNR